MKTLVKITLGLVAVLVIISYLFYVRLPDIASKSLSGKLKVPVEIADIRLFFNTIEIDGIEVANIPSKKLSKALSIETSVIKAPLTHYTEKTIVIDQIALDQIYLGLEFDSASGTSGNWTVLMNNMASASPDTANKDTVVLIKELVLTNIQVDVYYEKEGGKVKRLPPIDRIVLTNISTETGVPTDQILKSVLGKMLQSVFVKENLQNMLKGLLESPKNSLDTLISPFKGLFGQ